MMRSTIDSAVETVMKKICVENINNLSMDQLADIISASIYTSITSDAYLDFISRKFEDKLQRSLAARGIRFSP